METKTDGSEDIPMWSRVKAWARRMKRDTMALYLPIFIYLTIRLIPPDVTS